jgi:hypothetical protein
MIIQDKALRCPFCHQLNITPYNDGVKANCNLCGKEFTRHDEAKDLFHMLWGWGKESPHYYKEVWNRLYFIIGL